MLVDLGKITNEGPECDRPPPGWKCSRRKGHYGPCCASQVVPQSVVLDMLDLELMRLRADDVDKSFGSRRWRSGVMTARALSAQKVEAIREAYITERLGGAQSDGTEVDG